jgi:hypothetical protein
MDFDLAEDEDTFEVRFSADDLVCTISTIDTNLRTTANSAAVTGPVASAVGVSPATCTGGWTEWTTATGWNSLVWNVGTVQTSQQCYTIAADTEELDADIVETTIIDTYTVAGSANAAAVDATLTVTVTTTTGLASSSLLLWLFIILLLGGGGGAAYYFMVIEPAAM